MPSNDGQRLAQIIKESIDNFEIKDRFKSSEPCIIEDNHTKSDDIIEERLSFDAIKKMCIELGYYNRGIHVKQTNPLEMCYAEIPIVIYGTKHNIIIVDDKYQPKHVDHALEHEIPFPFNVVQFRPRNYASKECMELVDAILFQENKQPKENHPHGWYRKFEKKRF